MGETRALATFQPLVHPTHAALARVGGHLLSSAVFSLHDTVSGRALLLTDALPASASVTLSNHHFAWLYQNWLSIDGMRRFGERAALPIWAEYGQRVAQFWDRHVAYFSRQHAAGITAPPPPSDEKLAATAYYFSIGDLWQTGLGALAAETWPRTGAPWAKQYLDRYLKWFETHPRNARGVILRTGKGIQSDDPYLLICPLLAMAAALKREDLVDACVEILMGYHEALLDGKTGLYRHLRREKDGALEGEFWGRGNGWMTLAFVVLLETLPEKHPRRGEVLRTFQAHAETLARFQDGDGLWHQVMDHPETWAETSASGMFLFGLAKGTNAGWLSFDRSAALRKGLDSLALRVDEHGLMKDVCMSCDLGDFDYYAKRPRRTGNLHGFGPFLMAASEVLVLA